MNAQQEELDHGPECDVYIVVHEGTEVGRVLREVTPAGDERWRIAADASEGTYERVEDAARACIEYARGRDRVSISTSIPDRDASRPA